MSNRGKPTGWQLWEQQASESFAKLKQAGRFRHLQPSLPQLDSPLVSGHIDLTHNDYLGLRSSSEFLRRTREAITYLPPGAGASRLLGGEHPVFQQAENAFSEFKGAPSSLFFGSGYTANLAVATVLAGSDVTFFSDELNHASIIDGLRLAKIEKHRRQIFPHSDYKTLEEMLRQSTSPKNIVYTESVFSMDGDLADLQTLYDLCQKHNGILVVDEAHAVGAIGKAGRGLIEALANGHEKIISINPCGKALACQGAFVCGPDWFRQLMINNARSFIYSTGPSPWMAAALIESISMVVGMDDARQSLSHMSHELRTNLERSGFDCRASRSHVIPVVAGTDGKALALANYLSEHGILIKAIRPPTVPEGSSRVRVSLNAQLNNEHIAMLIERFRECRLEELQT